MIFTRSSGFMFTLHKIRNSSFRFVEFKFAFCGIQICIKRIKFAFCRIQVCIKRIKFAFRGIQVYIKRIKFAFGGIKFAFRGIKFAFGEIKFAFIVDSRFYQKNQVFVNACELHRTR